MGIAVRVRAVQPDSYMLKGLAEQDQLSLPQDAEQR